MSKKRDTKKSVVSPTKSKIVNPRQNSDLTKETVSKTTLPADLLFDKVNYMYILGGILLMVIGFFLMSGGNNPDPNTFDESIIYSTRRTLIAPIFILAGLIVQVLAIFKKTKQ